MRDEEIVRFKKEMTDISQPGIPDFLTDAGKIGPSFKDDQDLILEI